MRFFVSLFLGVLAVVGAAFIGAPVAAQSFPERGTAAVVDGANLLSPEVEAKLDADLNAFNQRTQRQFVVATIASLEGYDISDYGYQLGRKWGLGDKARNDGIILLIAPNERKMRIEVGYGLEGVMPDGLAYDIIGKDITPRFKAGDMQGGIMAGAAAIMQQLELPPEEAAKVAAEAAQQKKGKTKGGGFPLGLVIVLAFVFFYVILPNLRRGNRRRGYQSPWGNTARDIILWEVGKAVARGLSNSDNDDDWGGGFGGGGFGGGGFGGGGFGGGGGSFGGGGASGGW